VTLADAPEKRRFHQEDGSRRTDESHDHNTPRRGGERQPMLANHYPPDVRRSGTPLGTLQGTPEGGSLPAGARREPARRARRLLAAFSAPGARTGEASAASSAAAVSSREPLETTIARYAFFAVVALLAALLATCVALSVGAQEAFAQEEGSGGGGDAISQTLENVRNYLAGLAFGVGGIGFVASLLVKGYASINENAHAYAAMGMKGSLWCIIAGAIVTPILSIASGLAAGGGG